MEFKIKLFNELSPFELYDILKLRQEVFILEQNCLYLDTDAKDEKALHVIGIVDNRIVGYARVFGPGLYFENASIGRVVVNPKYRMYGYGHKLLEQAIMVTKKISSGPITISAQQYLENFYKSHNFVTVSDVYMEDDIPHLEMQLD